MKYGAFHGFPVNFPIESTGFPMAFGWKLPGRHHRHHLDQAADHSRPARPAGPAGPVATGAGCWDPGIIAIENGHRNSGFSHLQNGDFPWLCKRLPEGMTGWKPPYMMDICDVFLWYKKHKGTWKWVRGTLMDDINVFLMFVFLLCSYYNLLLVQRKYAFWLKRFIDAHSRTVELHDKWQQQVNACVQL